MKKFFKIGCGGFIALIVLAIVLVVMSDGEEKPSTGTDGGKSTSTEESTSTDTKKIDATNQVVDAAGLKVALGEVKISKDKIQVGINLENTTSNSISFYPDQGSAVVGNMQLDANMFLTDGDVSGDIQGGVLKEGVVEFLAPDGKEIDVASLTEIKFVFGDAFDSVTYDSKEVTFTVPVQ